MGEFGDVVVFAAFVGDAFVVDVVEACYGVEGDEWDTLRLFVWLCFTGGLNGVWGVFVCVFKKIIVPDDVETVFSV